MGTTCLCIVWTWAWSLLILTQDYALKWGRKAVVVVGDKSGGFAPLGCRLIKGRGKFGIKKDSKGREVEGTTPFHPISSGGKWSFSLHYSWYHRLHHGCGPTKHPGLGQMLLPSCVVSPPSPNFPSLCDILWSGTIPEMKEQHGLMQEHCTLYFILSSSPNSPCCCSPFAGCCGVLGWQPQTTAHSKISFWT